MILRCLPAFRYFCWVKNTCPPDAMVRCMDAVQAEREGAVTQLNKKTTSKYKAFPLLLPCYYINILNITQECPRHWDLIICTGIMVPGKLLVCANSFSPQQFLDIIQELKLFRDHFQRSFTNVSLHTAMLSWRIREFGNRAMSCSMPACQYSGTFPGTLQLLA